jgi:uncharacterized protein YigE (DUF2233 family)
MTSWRISVLNSTSPDMRPSLSLIAVAKIAFLASALADPIAFAPKDVSQPQPVWQPVYQGIDYRLDELGKPRILRIHTARIDTRAQGIRFFSTPDNGGKPGDVDGRRTASFLKEFDLELAINGTGFNPIVAEGKPVDVLGLSISEGKVVSELDRESRNPVLLITARNEVRIFGGSFQKQDLTNAHQAMQGWYGVGGLLVDNGKVVTEILDIHPRTAVGVSQDGRYLFLTVVDGRQPGLSEGMSLVELAEWMTQQLGCWDAMNLDGGGSTTMVMRNPDASARIVNSPSGGVQRSVANHLGVHAEPLAITP